MRAIFVIATATIVFLGAPAAFAEVRVAPETVSVQPAPEDADIPESIVERDKLLAELFTRLKESKDADASTRIATAIERLLVYSGSDTADLLLSRAGTAIEAKQNATARQVLDALIALEPRNAEAWNRRAYLDFSEQNYEAAISALAHVLSLEPRHFKALEGLGAIFKEIGQKRLALKAYRKLLEIHPMNAEAKTAEEALTREVEGQNI